MSIIDLFKSWWGRTERANVTVRTPEHLITFRATNAEIDITDHGSGYFVEDLLIEADRAEVIDRDDL